MFFNKPKLDFSSAYIEEQQIDPANQASTVDVFGSAFNGAKQQTLSNSTYFNLRDAYDQHNAKVKEITGEDLWNPEGDGIDTYDFETRRRLFDAYDQYKADGGTLGHGQYRRVWQEQEYRNKLDELAQKHPDRKAELVPEITFDQAGYKLRRDAAKAELDTYDRSGGGALNWIASVGGGLAAQAYDPVSWITAPVGFGGVGTGVKGILMGGLKAGAANALVETGLQFAPGGVLAQQQAAGLPSGLDVGAENVAMAFLFGAGLDMGIRGGYRGIAHGFGYSPVVKDGLVVAWRRKGLNASADLAPAPEINAEMAAAAQKGDEKAQAEIARIIEDHAKQTGETVIPHSIMQQAAEGGDIQSLRRVLEPEAQADPIIRTALDAAEANEILLARPDQRIPDGDHAETIAQTLRHVVAPESEPLPVRIAAVEQTEAVIPKIEAELAGLRAKGETPSPETAARIAALEDQIKRIDLFGLRDPIGDALRLRENPALLTADIDLGAKPVRDVRALAALSDEAFTMVQRGEAAPELGVLVGNYVADPQMHTRTLSDLEVRKPVSEDDARAQIADILRGPDYQPRSPDVQGPVPARAKGPRLLDDPTGPEAKAHIKQLEADLAEELAATGRAPTVAEMLTTDAGRAALVARADLVKQAISDLTGIVPPQVQVRVFDRIDDLPPNIRAQVRSANAAAFANALEVFQNADSLAARAKARAALDVAKRQEGIDGFELDGTIWLASYALNPRARFTHEAVHALRTLGQISPDEFRILAQAGRESRVFGGALEKQYVDAYAGRQNATELLDEEAAAHFVEAVARGDLPSDVRVDSQVRSLVDRIRAFFDRVRRALMGQGYRNADEVQVRKPEQDVIGAILSGEIAKREARAEWRRDAIQAIQSFQSFMEKEDITAVAVRPGYMAAFATELKGERRLAVGSLGERMTKGGVRRKLSFIAEQIAALQRRIDSGEHTTDEVASGKRVIKNYEDEAERLQDALGKFDGDIPRGKPFERSKVLPAGDKFAVRLTVDDRHGVYDGSRVYRIYNKPDGSLETLRQPSKDMGQPLGEVSMSQHPDGRWEVDMVEVKQRYRGKGVAKALYNAVESDIADRMRPSGILLPDGYAMWKARDAESVKWHIPVMEDTGGGVAYYLSPKRVPKFLEKQTSTLGNIQQLVADLEAESRAPRYPGELEKSRAYLVSLGQQIDDVRKAYAELPKEATSTKSLATMFAFAGEKAKTADLNALSLAKRMELDGINRDDIWTKTGWGRGVDGKWRFEIDDSGSFVKGEDISASDSASRWGPGFIGEYGAGVVAHRGMFDAYPEMANVSFNGRPGRGGRYQRGLLDDGTVIVGDDYRGKEKRSAALHEAQHVVQYYEDMASGGSEKSGVSAYNEISARINRLIDDAGGSLRNASPEVRQKVEALREEQKAMPFDPREYYKRLAGEVEARTVQKRMDMTAAERRSRPMWYDYDVPEEQQIVRFGEGVQNSGPMFAIRQDEPDAFDWGDRSTSGSRETKFGNTTITYGVQPRTKYAQVILVETAKDDRGQGSARDAMKRFVAEADRNGFTVSLTAEPMGKGGMGKTDLVKFYKSLGFVENKGRNKDFAVMAGMIRQPRNQPMFAMAQDTETGRSMRRDLDVLGFYSAALRAAKAWPQTKGTPEQALMWLKKSGVKESEIKATGLAAWLDEIGKPQEPNAPQLGAKGEGLQLQLSAQYVAEPIGLSTVDRLLTKLGVPFERESSRSLSGRFGPSMSTYFHVETPSGRRTIRVSDHDYLPPAVGGLDIRLGADAALAASDIYKMLGRAIPADLAARAEAGRAAATEADNMRHRYLSKYQPGRRDEAERAVRAADASHLLTNYEAMTAMAKAVAQRGQARKTAIDAVLRHYSRPAVPSQSHRLVTRDEIIEFLEKNRVGVKEKVYGERGYDVNFGDGEWHFLSDIADARQAVEEAGRGEIRRSTDPSVPPKWSSYSLDPSNPTYRETVIHLPNQSKTADVFQSGHFSEPNIIGHMMTSMTKHDGRPVYTIDQIQSDWGQKLRDGGVRDEKKIAELERKISAIEADEIAKAIREKPAIKRIEQQFGISLVPDSVWSKLEAGDINGGNLVRNYLNKVPLNYESDVIAAFRPTLDAIGKTPDDLKLYRAELSTMKAATPGHPLVNTTDQWTNTTLRRALRQAAEADAEYIAVPSGKTVLSYNPGDEHGMEGFYDKIVPKNLRNLIQKLDKDAPAPVRIDQLETPTSGMKGEGFTLFPLTEKVKRAVIDEGMPLFAMRSDHLADGQTQRSMGDGIYVSVRPGDSWGSVIRDGEQTAVIVSATPARLMQWDVAEQTPEVRRALDAIAIERGLDLTGKSGADVVAALGPDAMAVLRDAGIQGSVRGGDYVFYDHSAVEYDPTDVKQPHAAEADPMMPEVQSPQPLDITDYLPQLQEMAARLSDGVDPEDLVTITPMLKEIATRYGTQLDADTVSRIASDIAGGADVQQVIAREMGASNPAKSESPNLLYAMKDAAGRSKVGAGQRAKDLAADLEAIEVDLKNANIDEREAIVRKRASLLNAKSRDQILDDVNKSRNARGEADPANGLMLLIESDGVSGGAMDVKTLRDVISNEALGRLGSFVWEMKKGAITGDKRRTGKVAGNTQIMVRLENFIREAAGEKTGDAAAAAFAKAWLSTAEYLRQRFNAAGGDIAKLKGWFAPQWHDPEALIKAGREVWVAYMMKDGVLDRDRMVDFSGNRLDDSKMRELLQDIWRTITSNGANKREPSGHAGKGALYTRHADHRILHFKNADAYIAYAKEFGGADIYAMVIGHINMMSRDIAAMERFGPNPNYNIEWVRQHISNEAADTRSARSLYDDLSDIASDLKAQKDAMTRARIDGALTQIKTLHDKLDKGRKMFSKAKREERRQRLDRELGVAHDSLRDAITHGPMNNPDGIALINRMIAVQDEMTRLSEAYSVTSRSPTERADRILKRADEMWKLYMGMTNTPADGTIAGIMQSARNWISASSLVYASTSAITDQATGLAARAFIGMPATQQLSAFVRGFTAEDRKFALRAGLGLDQAMTAFVAQSRYAGQFDARSWSGYIADRSHAFSGLSPMTQAAKIGFGVDFMAWMADLAATARTMAKLEPWTADMLERHGWTPQDWADLTRVTPEVHRGMSVLTRAAIERDAGPDLAEKFMMTLLRERSMAVLEPTLRGRTAFISETKPGTIIGEMMRSVAMLKSFPTSYAMLILGRMFHEIQAGRGLRANTIAYAASIFVVGTMLGALVKQMKNIEQWKDPEDMSDPKFWGKAFMQSGGLGIFGDFVGNSVNRMGGGLAQTIMGPVADRGSTLLDATAGNIVQYAKDEKTNAGREAVKLLRQNTPGAFVPFYLRTAYERAILDEMQRYVDPDSHKSFQSRIRAQKKLGGNKFAWQPGAPAPSRLPDISAAFGAP